MTRRPKEIENPMPTRSRFPRLQEATCEFWFEAGTPWQPETAWAVQHEMERTFGHLPRGADGLDAEDEEPFVWFDANFLSVGLRRGNHWESHLATVHKALKDYQAAAHPGGIQSVSLRYQIAVPSQGVTTPRLGREIRLETEQELLTLQADPASADEADPAGVQLTINYLVTTPPRDVRRRLGAWLRGLHDTIDEAFVQYCRGQHAPFRRPVGS